MILFKNIFAACVIAVVFASCGGADSKEKIVADALSGMEEIVKIIEGVTDKASAEAATKKLDPIVERMNKLQDRAKALNISDEEMEKAMQADKKFKDLTGRLMGSMMKFMAKPEVAEILGKSMEKMKK